MFTFCITSHSIDSNDYGTFRIQVGIYPFDEDEHNNAIVVRDDYKFLTFKGVTYRVCMLDRDDETDDLLWVKVWINDPFIGFEEYEQICGI